MIGQNKIDVLVVLIGIDDYVCRRAGEWGKKVRHVF